MQNYDRPGSLFENMVTLKIDKGQVVTRSCLDREAQGSNLWQVK